MKKQDHKQEFIQILENMKKQNMCLRGSSYDYRKGFNDCQWEYYKLINTIIQQLNNS